MVLQAEDASPREKEADTKVATNTGEGGRHDMAGNEYWPHNLASALVFH